MILNNLNRIKRKRILVLSSLLISLMLIASLKNFNINANLMVGNQKYDKNEDSQNDILNTQDLGSDNSFTGVGAPWNVTHYANQTKTVTSISFDNNSYDDTHAKVNLEGWNGYQLNSSINNLYDTRNWINGTFHCGPDDGNYGEMENDSNMVANWTFNKLDTGQTNYMSGNYYDSSNAISDGQDCLELLIGDYNNYYYDVGDKDWWETTFQIDRGNIDSAWLSFAVRPKDSDAYNNHFVLQVLVNNKILWGNGLQSIIDASGSEQYVSATGENWGQWYKPPSIYVDPNDNQLFPNDVKNMNVTLEFKRVSGNTGSGYAEDYAVLIDNVSLTVKGEAKPTQLGLQLNGQDVNDNGNYGEGTLGINGNWNGSLQSSVIANFSSDSNWPCTYQDNGNWISYKVDLNANLNLYATKSTPETYYTADSSLEYQGSSFTTSNESNTNWNTYAHMEIPSGYEETNMTVEYPSDYNLTGIFFSLNPSSLSQASITEYGDKKVVNIPVSSITSNTNGFWKLTAESPNYCKEMDMYNNATSNWILNDEFVSGEYINITGKIDTSALVSGYIDQTQAQLQIRFPNGTIWSIQKQFKSVDSLGMVYFDPIRIPNNGPNYIAGEYEAIIRWNNSYSSFGLNETGIIYKKFTVIHDSLLYPDQGIFFIDNVAEDRIVNIKVSFNDLIDNSVIDYATVYTNFTGTIETLDRISPGFYLYEFNASKGNAGNNTVTIYANHSFYLNKNVNITVYVIKSTILTAKEYPSLEIAWNNNFTIHLNYTYKSNGIGIENANPTIEWNGEMSISSGNGLYNITLNSSRYQINKEYNLKIKFDKIGWEEQTIIVSVGIVPRETNIESILINNGDCTVNKTYNIKSGELLNFKVTFNDLESSGTFIKGAIVSLNKSTEIGEIFEENPTYYNLTLNSIYLGDGTSFINIIAEKANYTSTIILLTINVFERNTEYKVYLDGIDHTANPAITTYTNKFINLTISYKDTITTQFISGATVDVNGSGVSKVLGESFSNYTTVLNTTDLSFGINFLTIYARKGGYEPQSITLAIQIVHVNTELTLYLNGVDKTSNPAITRYTNQLINLTVSYKESISKLFISGATVDVNGSGVSEVLGESYSNYTIMLDTTDLNFGANFLTIYTRKGGYEPQSITLTIQIIQIETELTLYVNGVDKTSNPAITRYTNQLINLTVSYKESISKLFISGATVDVNGSGVSEVLGESYSNYTIMLDTTDLNFGANFLTIYARIGGYEPQSITLTIQIIQIETELELYLDANSTKYIEVIIGDFINLTVIYKEFTGSFIDNATIKIVGEGLSADTYLTKNAFYNQYEVSINTLDLNFGINLLTLYAEKPNYEPQTVQITIEITEKETDLHIFLNGLNKTIDRTLSVPIRSLLNVTVKYFDFDTGTGLSGATIQLVGEGLSLYLTENPTSHLYSISINTIQLDIGVRFLTIYAQRANYQSYSALLRIQVDRIRTNITTVSGQTVINRQPGQGYDLEIELIDLDFSLPILNATVTYTWTYGQGTLTDPEDDGIYEGTISNLVEGTFLVTISVYAGDDYEFERFTITLNVVRPTEDVLLFQILTILGIGAALGLGGYLFAYQRVLKYPKQVRKIRKYKGKLKSPKSTGIEIHSREQLIEENYAEKMRPLEKQLKSKLSPKV